MSAPGDLDERPLHFGEIDGTPDQAACGEPLRSARVDFRRGHFLRARNRCPTCAAVARAWCPEVEA